MELIGLHIDMFNLFAFAPIELFLYDEKIAEDVYHSSRVYGK